MVHWDTWTHWVKFLNVNIHISKKSKLKFLTIFHFGRKRTSVLVSDQLPPCAVCCIILRLCWGNTERAHNWIDRIFQPKVLLGNDRVCMGLVLCESCCCVCCYHLFSVALWFISFNQCRQQSQSDWSCKQQKICSYLFSKGMNHEKKGLLLLLLGSLSPTYREVVIALQIDAGQRSETQNGLN